MNEQENIPEEQIKYKLEQQKEAHNEARQREIAQQEKQIGEFLKTKQQTILNLDRLFAGRPNKDLVGKLLCSSLTKKKRGVAGKKSRDYSCSPSATIGYTDAVNCKRYLFIPIITPEDHHSSQLIKKESHSIIIGEKP